MKNSEVDVRDRIICFIKTYYAKTLCKDIELLNQPGGFELLHKKYVTDSAVKKNDKSP